MEKKGFEMSFAWLFALIVGAFILFLAILLSTHIINLGNTQSDAEVGKEIGILFNPLEIGFESAKSSSFSVPKETRISNICNSGGNFGEQVLRISQKSFNKWTDTDMEISFQNKYIFSDDSVEGKKFYIFSKPFEMPFKVADFIYMTSSNKQYCFTDLDNDALENVRDEIGNVLKQKNIFVENCTEDMIKVCFERGSNCDVNVDYTLGTVEKNSGKVYFTDDGLMYGAIFAEKSLYECQLKRLMKRMSELALLYKDKADFISQRGCNSNLNSELLQLSSLRESFIGSANLDNINSLAEDIQNKNDLADCKLW